MSVSAISDNEAIYDTYAAAYDRSGQIRFSIMMDLYLREVLARHPAPGRKMLDLACGTGTLALMQAEAGWDVTGLDASRAMLRQARRKRRMSGGQATFVEGDLRDFIRPAPVDLVTCFYDSMNYLLTDDDLRDCFLSVARTLVPGGLLCCDLATDYFLRTHWQGVELFEDGDYSQVMSSSYNDLTGLSTLILTGFVQTRGSCYRRFREVHVERAYPSEVVERLLREAGLSPEALYDCFTFQEPNDASLRHFWVARKPAA